MTPDEYCQQKAAGSGSSFYYSFVFLPAERRRAITALYAFCREVDDVVDEGMEPQVAAARLAWWRAEVARLLPGPRPRGGPRGRPAFPPATPNPRGRALWSRIATSLPSPRRG